MKGKVKETRLEDKSLIMALEKARYMHFAIAEWQLPDTEAVPL